MKIIVVGAYGFTGKLICAQLSNMAISFAIAGRNTEKLRLLQKEFQTIKEIRTTDITLEKGCDFVSDYDLIINCIGPFDVFSKLLVTEAVKQSKVYFDITGEEVFVANSIAMYHKMAIQNKALIVHAVAFESALASLLAYQLIQRNINVKHLNTYYHFNQSKPSPGTRFTMKLSKYRDTFFVIDGKNVAIEDLSQFKTPISIAQDVYYTLPYPMPEIPLLQHKFGIQNIASYLLTDELSASIATAKNLDKKKLSIEIQKFTKRKPKAPTKEQRAAQSFDLLVESITDKGYKDSLLWSGSDMYLLTAKIIAFFVKTQVNNRPNKYGVISPHELLIGNEIAFLDFLKSKIN